MRPVVRVVLRWLFVTGTIAASTLVAFILLNLSIWPDRPVIAGLRAIGVKVFPRAVVHLAHLLTLLVIAMAWVLPPAAAVASATRVRLAKALGWGVSISVLLLGAFEWFVSWDAPTLVARSFALTAALAVIAGLCLSKLRVRGIVAISNSVGTVLLFIPAAIALVHSPTFPSRAAPIWTTVLQPQNWYLDVMNTDSEYAATRQLAFLGDKVAVVFDAAQAPYQGNQPMSNYRLVCLDARTGTKKSEIDFVGHWGSMPFIYAAQDGYIDVQTDPPRVLNPDLTDVPRLSSTTRKGQWIVAARQGPTDEFDPNRWILGRRRILRIEGGEFQVLDQDGKNLTKGTLIEPGTYAGASQDGSRFAIESSYSEGDPMFLVYEYFTIYSSDTGTVVASVWIKDLPEQQSWSALSPDGRSFIAGKPGELTMYSVP